MICTRHGNFGWYGGLVVSKLDSGHSLYVTNVSVFLLSPESTEISKNIPK